MPKFKNKKNIYKTFFLLILCYLSFSTKRGKFFRKRSSNFGKKMIFSNFYKNRTKSRKKTSKKNCTHTKQKSSKQKSCSHRFLFYPFSLNIPLISENHKKSIFYKQYDKLKPLIFQQINLLKKILVFIFTQTAIVSILDHFYDIQDEKQQRY